jgi:hypothetical protein
LNELKLSFNSYFLMNLPVNNTTHSSKCSYTSHTTEGEPAAAAPHFIQISYTSHTTEGEPAGAAPAAAPMPMKCQDEAQWLKQCIDDKGVDQCNSYQELLKTCRAGA